MKEYNPKLDLQESGKLHNPIVATCTNCDYRFKVEYIY